MNKEIIKDWLSQSIYESGCFDCKHPENSTCYGSVRDIDAAVALLPTGNSTRDFLSGLLDGAVRDLLEELACVGDCSPAQAYDCLRANTSSGMEDVFAKFFGLPVDHAHKWTWPDREATLTPAEEETPQPESKPETGARRPRK